MSPVYFVLIRNSTRSNCRGTGVGWPVAVGVGVTGSQVSSDAPAERGSPNGGIRQRLRGEQKPPHRPWRVEGVQGGDQPPPPRPPMRWSRVILLLVGLLLVNWVVSSVL